MKDFGPTEALPGNLSEQQQLVLALLAIEAERSETTQPRLSYSELSWTVAEEFDDGEGSRIINRDAPRQEAALRMADKDPEEREMIRILRRSGPRHMQSEVLSHQHAVVLSRSIRRLEDRGYVERKQDAKRHHARRGEPVTTAIVATDRGLRAGREAIRRHQDGRYNLEFSTLSVDADADSEDIVVKLPD